MFEIINEEKKQIVICLHLEEIYTEMYLKNHIKNQERLFSIDSLSTNCVEHLVQQTFIGEEYSNYECIVDFTHIKYIAPNSKGNFFQWLRNLPNVKVSHCAESDFQDEIKEYGIAEDSMLDYRDAFNDYGKKYVLDHCLAPSGYTTQIGIRLGVYIDIKKIINDSVEMLRWCYVIAYDLNKYFSSVGEDADKRTLFFCHTMNGTYIAGILSQLLSYDLVYVDHLGPYNKLNKVDFYKGKSRTEEFIIVADLICLGNEFLRAKNIVEYIGGTVKGCAGILQMNISTLPSQYRVHVFAIEYTPESARNELNYTIRTELCPINCNECNLKEV